MIYTPNSNKSLLWKKTLKDDTYESIKANRSFKTFDVNKGIRNRLYKEYATAKKHYNKITNGKNRNIIKGEYNSASDNERTILKGINQNPTSSLLELSKSTSNFYK